MAVVSSRASTRAAVSTGNPPRRGTEVVVHVILWLLQGLALLVHLILWLFDWWWFR
jgi:hypothetical protein